MSFGIPVRNGLGIGLTPSTALSTLRVGGRPAMFLNFVGTTSLSSMVTFSRGSNATLVDSTGKITYAPANLLLQSQTFDNASWVKDAATFTANATTAPDGTSTADKFVATATTAFHGFYQSITGTVASYTYSVFAKAAEYSKLQLANGGAGTWSATFDLATGATIATGGTAVLSSSIQSVGNGWYRCAVTFTGAAVLTSHSAAGYPNTGATLNNFGASYTGDGTSGTFLWGAQLEPVTYQTTPSTYVATTSAAYYGPRFDYDPVTLAAKGLLIEQQRTNLLLQSQTFDTGTWSKSDATVTANATTAPDGTSTADKLAETATTAQHYLFQSAGSAATHTATIYAKAAERSWIIVTLNSSNTFFNLSNGTVGSVPGGFTAVVTDAGNGWYRCSVTATLPASGPIVFSTSTANNVTSYAGTAGSGIFLWGAQLEAGSFATSYIPTVASQVTRSADVATMTGTNFSSWYNATEGTFVASFDQNAVNSEVGYVGEVRTDNNNRIQLFANNGAGQTQLTVRNGGALQADLATTGSITQGAVVKAAYAYKASDFATVRDGGAAATGLTGTIPTVASFLIGFSQVASNLELNGHIRQIAYYNTRLPNATLVSLTA